MMGPGFAEGIFHGIVTMFIVAIIAAAVLAIGVWELAWWLWHNVSITWG